MTTVYVSTRHFHAVGRAGRDAKTKVAGAPGLGPQWNRCCWRVTLRGVSGVQSLGTDSHLVIRLGEVVEAGDVVQE